MALPGPRPAPGPSGPLASGLTPEDTSLAEAVEVYRRTYTTVLRSTGETRLRVLEASHKAMHSSLHSLADSQEPDLGAFLYAVRRLPEAMFGAQRVVMGQSAEIFARRGFGSFGTQTEIGAPGRRRRWYDAGNGTLAVLIASASDVDDLIPTLVAFQIEWNKLHAALGASTQRDGTPAEFAAACGGSEDDWAQLMEVWGAAFASRLDQVRRRRLSLRIRMLGGTQVGYARVTRRWWQQVTGLMRSEGLLDRPVYFVSSNSHSLGNLVTGLARRHQDDLVASVERNGPDELRDELRAFREGRAEGNWDNLLYYAARMRLRGVLDDAQETVVPLTGQSSHQLGALAQANALIIVPEDVTRLEAGDGVDVMCLP